MIPNKVFQILLAGKTLITRDSTAIRELIPEHFAGVTLVEPASASGLANAVKDIVTNNKNKDLDPSVSKIYELITPGGIGVRLIEYLKRLL